MKPIIAEVNKLITFFILVLTTSCSKTFITDGLYTNESKKVIVCIKSDSIYYFIRGFMSSGYDTYYGKTNDKSFTNKVTLKLNGYQKSYHTDSISTAYQYSSHGDSIQFMIYFYDKSDYYPIISREVRLYRKDKIKEVFNTNSEGKIKFSIPADEIKRYAIWYGSYHPQIKLINYKDSILQVYVAFPVKGDLNYFEEYINIRIKTDKSGRIIKINKGIFMEASKIDLENFIIKGMKMALPEYWN